LNISVDRPTYYERSIGRLSDGEMPGRRFPERRTLKRASAFKLSRNRISS
jgi:hypothetical protein